MTYTEMKNNKMALQVINEQEVLGKQFKMYGTVQEPLFLATDVANWIEHSNVSKMLNSVDEDEKVKRFLGVTNCYGQVGHGGIRENTEMWFLTEYGLYEVLMLSRKPIAKQFKKEVKGILKQIRLTGGYIPISAEDTDEMIEQRAKEIASKTVAIKDEIIAEQQAQIEKLQAEVDFHKEDVKDCERLIGVLCDDVKYLFNDTDFGVHSVSDAYEIVSHSVNGSRKFVKWFNEHNGKIDVIDIYIDDNGSRIKNAIDLSDINVFHDFKDLVFAYQQEQQGFTRK